MTLATLPFAGTFAADRHHSSFQFGVKHMSVASFRATFDDVDARVVATESGVHIEGTVRVESISIKSPPEFREHVVYGADFFDGHNHPEITFRSDDVDLAADGTFSGRGELVIRGVTRTIDAFGTYQPLVEDPYGSMRTAIELHATVDRRDWGIGWQAPLPGGGDALGYEVELTAHIELVKES